MKITKNGKRKAISPILATVILIAITLIAAVAIAGFVFGLFGTYMTSATVSVTSAICSHTGTCTLTLTNTGTASTVEGSGGVINFAGASAALTCTSLGTLTGGGGSAADACTFTHGVAVAGMAFTGSVGLANGGQAGFAGTFS